MRVLRWAPCGVPPARARISSLCSPSVGGGRTSSARSPSNETGERTVRNRPITGCVAEAVSSQVPRLRIFERFAGVVHRRMRHVLALQALRTTRRAARRLKRSPSSCDQRLLVLDAGVAGREARRRRTGRAARSRRARPCQNFSGDDMCSAIHLPSAHSQHVRLRDAAAGCTGPSPRSTWKKWVKASRLKCAIASSIETSTVRPTPVRPRSNSAPSTP